MHHFSTSFNIDQPTHLLYQPALNRHYPNIVEIGDPWQRYGSGIGRGTSATRCALGEFYERRHFYMEVATSGMARIEDTLTPQETDDFTKAFKQTKNATQSDLSITTHHFRKTTALRLIDYSECEIPTVCLSINPTGLNIDNNFFPVRDTCGCSFHWDLETVITGALKESLERQFLLRYWLTKEITRQHNISLCKALLTGSPAAPLLDALLAEGSISVFDITDSAYPGHCALMLYGAEHTTQHVHYCAGMGYGSDVGSAIEKAALELWQTFRFIRDFHLTARCIEDIEDPYLLHFMLCNKFTTYLEATSGNTIATSLPTPPPRPLSLETLRKNIIQNNLDGFLYLQQKTSEKTIYFYCKYISPRIFMHMNNATSINLHNAYSGTFSSKINPNRSKTMVPFP
ncbi:YcaO-like family protein [Pseudomonas silvicola]|nr:YcaO-like family protein [Pseudomonas silvicola]